MFSSQRFGGFYQRCTPNRRHGRKKRQYERSYCDGSDSRPWQYELRTLLLEVSFPEGAVESNSHQNAIDDSENTYPGNLN